MKLAVTLCVLVAVLAEEIPSSRIVGGEEAAVGQFPHQISLRNGETHECGGSIINETTVLTAAHCVRYSRADNYYVVTGTNKLDTGGDRYKVNNFIIYPRDDPINHQFDLAIIKLETPIRYNVNVQPVKLRRSNIGGNETVILSGWGAVRLGGGQPNNLQFIKLRTISVEECREKQTMFDIIDSQLCTLTMSGEGPCHGDSGGALVDENGEQVGVVNWGRPCARGDPDVFARVYSFLDWIDSNS